MKRDTHEIVEQSDEIFEIAKKIKAWRNRYFTKRQKIEDAKQEVIDLKTELLEIAESMMWEEDTQERRDPGQVNREIDRAKKKLASAEERNASDVEEMDALCDQLAHYLLQPEQPDQSGHLDQPEAGEVTFGTGEPREVAFNEPQVDPLSESEVPVVAEADSPQRYPFVDDSPQGDTSDESESVVGEESPEDDFSFDSEGRL